MALKEKNLNNLMPPRLIVITAAAAASGPESLAWNS
jgi:hypothetical protein